MDVSDPATVVLASRTAEVVRALAGTDHPLGIRELARISSVSPNRTHQVVDKLAEHGVVLFELIGSQRVCRLNREHLATEPLVAIALLRSRLFEFLQAEIQSWEVEPLHASVFGSTAREDGDTDSDIDILVVFRTALDRHSWDPVESGADHRILRATGNQPNWVALSRRKFNAAIEDDEPIVADWREDNVHLVGPTLRALVRAAR